MFMRGHRQQLSAKGYKTVAGERRPPEPKQENISTMKRGESVIPMSSCTLRVAHLNLC